MFCGRVWSGPEAVSAHSITMTLSWWLVVAVIVVATLMRTDQGGGRERENLVAFQEYE